MRSVPLVLSIVLSAGCVAQVGAYDEEVGGHGCVDDCDRDAQGIASDPSLFEEIKAKYGVRPRLYSGLFNGSNRAERRFLTALPAVAAFLNPRLAAISSELTVTEAELATNFITEGGFFALDRNATGGLDGFGYFGIDTLVDNYQALKPWLHPTLQTMVESGSSTATYTNEKGEKVRTLNNLSIEDGLYANAGMFAWSRMIAHQDLGAAMNTRERRFFWTTVYYNAGPGTGRNLVAKWGASYAESRWTKADDANLYGTNVLFNALWRTASWDYMARTTYAQARPAVPPDELCTDGADNDGDGKADLQDDDCANSGSACSATVPCKTGEQCISFDGGASGLGMCLGLCDGAGKCGAPSGTHASCKPEVAGDLCLFACELDGKSYFCPAGGQKCVETGEPGYKICAP